MTLQEFIDEYSWEQARKWHAEILAQNTRRPKQWTLRCTDGLSYTVFFDGCPCRLKSKKMVDWLRAFFLLAEAESNEPSYGLTEEDQVILAWASIMAQLSDNLWVLDPPGLPQVLCRIVLKVKAYDDGMELFAMLKNIYDEKIRSEQLPVNIYWGCVQASLLLCIYLIETSLITGNISDETFEALDQLTAQLNGIIEEAREDDVMPDFSVEAEHFEHLTKLIPKIEENGNEKLIRMAYEFAHDYYQATRRFTLAEKFSAKLNKT